MREVQKRQLQFGQVPVDKVWLDPKSRDDIPAVLKGLQHLYKEKQEELFMLLEKHILPGTHRGVGRPGMEMWRILVLGVLKQGLGCDFDRLHNLANHHETVRAMLGHSDFADKTHYELQTIVDNVSLMRPELLVEVGRLVVESGHAVARKKPGERLRGRCDSFVVETDVHYPTDLGLLWDGVRCLIRETARAAAAHGVGGWRQHRQLGKRVKEGFNPVRSARRGKQTPEKVETYLGLCRDLVERAEGTVKALVEKGVGEAECRLIRGYIDHARRQIDQVDRRLLQGERIPHQEKVFSIFEPHTRWISKGKAGRPVELGVAVCVVEDQYQFILHHKLLWKEDDVEVAVPMIEETQALYPDLRMCSFDRGFHSRNNRIRLDDRLELNALPGKGRRNRAAREREEAEEFAAMRRQHPAVESAINSLEHRGLDRVRTHGSEGFARMVALSVLAGNLHRLGRLLRQQEQDARKRRRRHAA